MSVIKVELSERCVQKLAQAIADAIIQGMSGAAAETPTSASGDLDLVSTAEAAAILGISPAHLRKIKDRFPHVRVGTHGKGKLLFLRSGLWKGYLEE